jgi:cysteine desulfuration protein SufE
MTRMLDSCIAKQRRLKELFAPCATAELRYQKLIELGKTLPPLPLEERTEETLVTGCQSLMHLSSSLCDGKMVFRAASDALISAGLAALLIAAYDGEPPEAILQCPPSFIDDLRLTADLTPGRSNGLASMWRRMRQDTIKLYAKLIVS